MQQRISLRRSERVMFLKAVVEAHKGTLSFFLRVQKKREIGRETSARRVRSGENGTRSILRWPADDVAHLR